MIQGQIQTETKYSGSFNLMTTVLKKEGIRGIYRGFVMQQFTYGPFNAMALMEYNWFKKALEGSALAQTSQFLANATAGFAAFGSAAAITTPFDVIKTRRQVQMSNKAIFNYTSSWDCCKQILK